MLEHVIQSEWERNSVTNECEWIGKVSRHLAVQDLRNGGCTLGKCCHPRGNNSLDTGGNWLSGWPRSLVDITLERRAAQQVRRWLRVVFRHFPPFHAALRSGPAGYNRCDGSGMTNRAGPCVGGEAGKQGRMGDVFWSVCVYVRKRQRWAGCKRDEGTGAWANPQHLDEGRGTPAHWGMAGCRGPKVEQLEPTPYLCCVKGRVTGIEAMIKTQMTF